MTKRELLILIGDGEYGSDIPNDDETNGFLSELMDEGLIKGEQVRMDDYFCITKAGRQWLLSSDAVGGTRE